MSAHRPQHLPTRLFASLLAAFLPLLITAACAPDPEIEETEQHIAPVLPQSTGDPQHMEGSWWALSPEAPYRALRLDLEPTDDPDAWTGTWISFSWRGSDNEDSLSRRSRPVRMSARIERHEVVITGPAPQFDEPGTPNGDSGHWELRLRLVSQPDKSPVYSGVMLHDEYTRAQGVSVKLTRTFERWPT